MNFYRAYVFKCLCGRWARGRYPVANITEAHATDPLRAICHKISGLPANAKGRITSRSPDPHEVGCGRTLAEVDAAIAERRAAEVLAGSR